MSEDIINELNARTFAMVRNGDESGVSGTGRVLDGILWPNGWVTIMWRTDLDAKKSGLSSSTTFSNYRAFEEIHISSHPTNGTEIVWEDDMIKALKAELAEVKDLLAKKSDKLKEANKKIKELKVTEDE